MVLEQLVDCPHIVKLYDQVCDPSTKTPSLVLEFVPNTDFRTLYPLFDKTDI